MKRKLTESEKVAKKNAAAIRKQRQDRIEYAALQERVRRGELTAGEAFRIQCEKGGPRQ